VAHSLEDLVVDRGRELENARAVTAEFRGDVCVLRFKANGRSLAPDLSDSLSRCREAGVTQVVLDVDPAARFGPAEVRVLSEAAETFHRDGGAVVMAVEDRAARAVLAGAGLVRPPLPPPADAGSVAPAVDLAAAPHWEHEFRFAATTRGLPVARRRVAAFAEVGGLSEDGLFEFSVAVAEALANALVHGSPRGDGDEIRVRFYCYDDVVAVEVADAGAGMHATPICLPGGSDTGGRGIHFMRALCDAVQFTCGPQGTHVLLVKRRR
jgi:anti-sigma regulatory factor (Ser/Thr protein kinase)